MMIFLNYKTLIIGCLALLALIFALKSFFSKKSNKNEEVHNRTIKTEKRWHK